MKSQTPKSRCDRYRIDRQQLQDFCKPIVENGADRQRVQREQRREADHRTKPQALQRIDEATEQERDDAQTHRALSAGKYQKDR